MPPRLASRPPDAVDAAMESATRQVGTVRRDDVTKDEALAMIIMGKRPGEVSERELAELLG